MKLLINIRGASASGKTTVVKQFCDRNGFLREQVETPFGAIPVSVIARRNAVALGDYGASRNTLGADLIDSKDKINDGIIAIIEQYAPDIIIYERLLTSNTAKATIETAQIAEAYGYKYRGIYLDLPDEERLKRLKTRSGDKARTKTFAANNNDRMKRTCVLLREAGYDVGIIDASRLPKEKMWKMLEYGIQINKIQINK